MSLWERTEPRGGEHKEGGRGCSGASPRHGRWTGPDTPSPRASRRAGASRLRDERLSFRATRRGAPGTKVTIHTPQQRVSPSGPVTITATTRTGRAGDWPRPLHLATPSPGDGSAACPVIIRFEEPGPRPVHSVLSLTPPPSGTFPHLRTSSSAPGVPGPRVTAEPGFAASQAGQDGERRVQPDTQASINLHTHLRSRRSWTKCRKQNISTLGEARGENPTISECTKPNVNVFV